MPLLSGARPGVDPVCLVAFEPLASRLSGRELGIRTSDRRLTGSENGSRNGRLTHGKETAMGR